LASAEAKLLALYGNTEHDFDLGNDGENAAKGSYIRILYDKLKYKEEQFAAKRIELNKVARELEEKKDELAEKETEIEAKDDEIRSLKEQATQLNQQISNLNSQIQSKNQEISSKSQEISHLNDQIREKDAEIERLRKENETLKDDTSSNSQELERLRAENRQKQDLINSYKYTNNQLRGSLAATAEQRDEALRDVEYWKDKYNKAISNPSGGDSSAEELKKAKAKLVELTGVDDPDYDLGTDGENAKAGSYIYNLNAKIQQLTRDRDKYRKDYEDEVRKNEELKKLQGSMTNRIKISGNYIGFSNNDIEDITINSESATSDYFVSDYNNISPSPDLESDDDKLALGWVNYWTDKINQNKTFIGDFNKKLSYEFTINFDNYNDDKNKILSINGVEKTIDEWANISDIQEFSEQQFSLYYTIGQKIRNYDVIRVTSGREEAYWNGLPTGHYNSWNSVDYKSKAQGFQMSDRTANFKNKINIKNSKNRTSITFTIEQTISLLYTGRKRGWNIYYSLIVIKDSDEHKKIDEMPLGTVVLFDDIKIPKSEWSRFNVYLFDN
ncbi:hypothetical protein, partial [Mycoplasmopsis pullorum]|uniref:hypothetical protein n=1 Tax=Mycoplasmopsis pullorum TaxID=48003 RepID=UPI0015D5A713